MVVTQIVVVVMEKERSRGTKKYLERRLTGHGERLE